MLLTPLTLIAFLLAFTSLTSFAAPLEKRITHSGQGTWYEPGLGNCGDWDGANSPVVALSLERYGSGGNCNQWVEIHHNGKTAYGKVRDSCQGCNTFDLDMSPSLFSQLAPTSAGRISITWSFMPKGWQY